jgi:hypothetical protein
MRLFALATAHFLLRGAIVPRSTLIIEGNGTTVQLPNRAEAIWLPRSRSRLAWIDDRSQIVIVFVVSRRGSRRTCRSGSPGWRLRTPRDEGIVVLVDRLAFVGSRRSCCGSILLSTNFPAAPASTASARAVCTFGLSLCDRLARRAPGSRSRNNRVIVPVVVINVAFAADDERLRRCATGGAPPARTPLERTAGGIA